MKFYLFRKFKRPAYSFLSTILFFQFLAYPFSEAMAGQRNYRVNQQARQKNYVNASNQRNLPKKTNKYPQLKTGKVHLGEFNQPDDIKEWNEFLKAVRARRVTLKNFEDGPKQVGNSVVTGETFRLIDIFGGNHTVTDNFLQEKGKGYLNLMLGMGMTDFLWAVTSNDFTKVKEWFESMLSFQQFHLNMIVFELTMLATNVGGNSLGNAYFRSYYANPELLEAVKNGGVLDIAGDLRNGAEMAEMAVASTKSFRFFQSALNFAVLPMGDMVSSYFSNLYHDPKMEAYRKLYDPHTSVVDPDHPDQPATNTAAVRHKVQSIMRLQLLNNLIAENNTWEKWEKITGHGLQLGLVATGFGMLQKFFLAPLEVTVKDGTTTLVYKGANSLMAEALGQATKARTLFVVENFDFAAFAEWGLKIGSKGSWFFGGIVGQVVWFFVLDKVVSVLIDPVLGKHKSITQVKSSIAQLNRAVNWYLDPNRTEYLPWSEFRPNTREWYWTKFFAEYNGDMNSDFFKSNGYNKQKGTYDVLDKGFTEDNGVNEMDGWEEQFNKVEIGFRNKGWHWGFGWETMVYDQAFNFMRLFSEKYLGAPVDEAGFYSCFHGNHAAAVPCYEQWYIKNTPVFVANLKNFKTQDYVKARIFDANASFNKYRGEIILSDMNETWQRWTKQVNEDMQKQARKENYFIWIARGMDNRDPFFIENNGFWHPDLKEKGEYNFDIFNPFAGRPVNLDREVWNEMIPAFDFEVLGANVAGATDCAGSGASAAKAGAPVCDTRDHATLMKDFIAANRANLNKSWLVPVMKNQYTKIFQTSKTEQEVEQEAVAKKAVRNYFETMTKNEKKEQELAIMEKNQHRLRWFLDGMTQTPDFVENKPMWHPEDSKQLDQWTKNAIAAVLVAPYFTNRDPDSPEGKALLDSQTADMLALLTQQNPAISDQNRDYFTIVMKTYAAIQASRDAFQKKLEDDNKHYKELLRADLAPTWFQSHFGGWFPSIVDKWTNKFNMPSKNKEWALHSQAPSFIQNVGNEGLTMAAWESTANWVNEMSALPKGSINTFNVEINYYTKIINDTLDSFVKNGEYTPAEIQNELVGFQNGAPYIMEKAYRMGALISTLLQANPNGFSDHEANDMVYEAVITTIQLAVLVAENNAPAAKKPVKPGDADDADEAPEGPRERAMKLAQSLLVLTHRYWGDIPQKIIIGKEKEKQQQALNNLIAHKRILLNRFQAQVRKVVEHIQARGWGYASPQDEDQLRSLLENSKFAMPLMGAALGTQAKELFVASTFGSQIVNAENDKSFQARLGCYLMGDEVCKQ